MEDREIQEKMTTLMQEVIDGMHDESLAQILTRHPSLRMNEDQRKKCVEMFFESVTFEQRARIKASSRFEAALKKLGEYDWIEGAIEEMLEPVIKSFKWRIDDLDKRVVASIRNPTSDDDEEDDDDDDFNDF